jgi:hypothetical protein
LGNKIQKERGRFKAKQLVHRNGLLFWLKRVSLIMTITIKVLFIKVLIKAEDSLLLFAILDTAV